MCRVCNGEGIVRDRCIDHGPAGLLFCDCDEGRYRKAEEYKHNYPQPASSADLLNEALDNLSQRNKAAGMVECWTCEAWFKADGRHICPKCRDEKDFDYD